MKKADSRSTKLINSLILPLSFAPMRRKGG
jgi:hypothetical protein